MANKNTNNKTENSNNQIQKPVSVIMSEARDKIATTLNGIDLHPVLLEMILKEIYLDVQNQAKYISEREMQEYMMRNVNINNQSVSENKNVETN